MPQIGRGLSWPQLSPGSFRGRGGVATAVFWTAAAGHLGGTYRVIRMHCGLKVTYWVYR
jgi:hypothetical protein